MQNKKLLKILIPILMLCVVLGIYFVQNQEDTYKVEETKTTQEVNKIEPETPSKIEEALTETIEETETIEIAEEPILDETNIEDLVYEICEEEPVCSIIEYPFHVDSIELESLKQSGLPLFLDFGSEDCPPCRQMKPALEAMYEKMIGKAIIQYVDVWEYPEAAEGYPIPAIPTQIFMYPDGTPYYPSEELAMQIQFYLYADRETEEHLYTAHHGALNEEQMMLILEELGVKHD